MHGIGKDASVVSVVFLFNSDSFPVIFDKMKKTHNGRLDGWTDRRTDRWMDGGTDRRMDRRTYPLMRCADAAYKQNLLSNWQL